MDMVREYSVRNQDICFTIYIAFTYLKGRLWAQKLMGIYIRQWILLWQDRGYRKMKEHLLGITKLTGESLLVYDQSVSYRINRELLIVWYLCFLAAGVHRAWQVGTEIMTHMIIMSSVVLMNVLINRAALDWPNRGPGVLWWIHPSL